jgi:hypothetical protein
LRQTVFAAINPFDYVKCPKDSLRGAVSPYIFDGALALAMHCHLPLGIFIQVSTQRS